MAKNLISELTSNGANIILQVSLDDLKETVKSLWDEERIRLEESIRNHQDDFVLTRKEVGKVLKVSQATLLRWENNGYLKPHRIGNKILYKPSDVEEILNKK